MSPSSRGGKGGSRKTGSKTSRRRGSASGFGGGSRELAVRVKSARGRSSSSTRWLQRQLNDPYVAEAKRLGYRSRAAFKLVQIDDKYRIIKPGSRVVDLGAAPGGWTQVAVERAGAAGQVVGIDILEMDPVAGAQIIKGDFLAEDAPQRLTALLGGAADLVLSDMAAPATGHAQTDHLRIMALAEAALDFAVEVLAPDGAFLAKVLQGGSERELLIRLRAAFRQVRHVKPAASRQDSAELYVLATGFRGEQVAEGQS